MDRYGLKGVCLGLGKLQWPPTVTSSHCSCGKLEVSIPTLGGYLDASALFLGHAFECPHPADPEPSRDTEASKAGEALVPSLRKLHWSSVVWNSPKTEFSRLGSCGETGWELPFQRKSTSVRQPLRIEDHHGARRL